YQWKVNGNNVGSNNPVYSYVPANNDVITCRLTTGDACVATSNAVTMIVNGTQTTLTLQNITIFDGRSKCYDALQTIIVAGNGTTFTVQAGGDAVLLAGQNILFLPGTKVIQDGHLQGKITTPDQFCNAKSAAFASMTEGEDEKQPVLENFLFKVYPNPTTGNFILEQKNGNQDGTMTVEIFNMIGKIVVSSELSGKIKHEFMFADMPAGLYFIRIINGDLRETIKLVKSR
ncbi:MAG: T9SS type A sorting domain-containing protein, partial [Bacteroidetes bacterium]|nr:T9SS type A sorting domain-containing protein [Bacteroidota bacterium]